MNYLWIPRQRWVYFPASFEFERACAEEATRLCLTLGAVSSDDAWIRADAYLMGGEL